VPFLRTYIYIYSGYSAIAGYYTFSLATDVQEFYHPVFFHFLVARLCASPPKFLRPLGEIRMMANGGNQTAVTVAVCVRRVTRARRIAFSLPGHCRRLNNNTAGGVFGCYRSTKPRVTSVVAWWAWRARAVVCTYVFTVRQVRRGRRRNLIHAHVSVCACFRFIISRLFIK